MLNRRRLRFQSLEDRHLLAGDFPGAVDLSALRLDTSTYDPSSILVKFADDNHANSLTGEQFMQGTTIGRSIVPGIFRVELADTADYQSALTEYLNDPAVVFAQPDYRVYIQQTPNDPELGNMWPLENDGVLGGTEDADIDAAGAWDLHTGSGDLVVAVIDTGVDYTHPDLAANMWVNPGEGNTADGIDNDGNGYVDDIHGYNFVAGNGDPFDDHGHGTHVAGTIGAVGDNGIGVTGINWDVQIMALKFLDSSGQGSTSDAIEAIYYAVNQGATISNNSWGGDPFSSALLQAITDAGSAGHIFVTAAGNGNEFGIGQDNDAAPFYPSSHGLANLVSVAASDDRDLLGVFSNYGADSVDLAAPGVDILSTLPGGTYGYNSGTSMAAPHVAGVLSLVWDFNPSWTMDQVIDQVLSTVDPVPWLNGIVSTGGRLNAAAAIGNAEPPAPAPVPGNLPSSDSFDDGDADDFLIQSGFWEVINGRYEATRVVDNDSLPAIATLNVDSLPDELLLEATVNSAEGRIELFGLILGDDPTNGFLVFDYQDLSNFKFAGADMDDGRWVIGHRSESGWHSDAFVNAALEGDTDYQLQLLLGSDQSTTLIVDGNTVLSHAFGDVLTDGDVGLGMKNATTSFDHFLAIDLANEGPQLERAGGPSTHPWRKQDDQHFRDGSRWRSHLLLGVDAGRRRSAL